MGDRYSETGTEAAVSGSLQTVLGITGDANVRGRLYDFTISQSSTPEDSSVNWTVSRYTVAPTGTSVTPTPLDDGAPAAQLAAVEDAGTTGTHTANTELFDQDINERAAYRWVAAPGGELVIPANAANGIAIRVTSGAYTGIADTTAHHEE